MLKPETMEGIILGQMFFNFSVNSNAATQHFVQAQGQCLHVHGRCGQILDKRCAELDIAEGRGQTAFDPTSRGFHLATEQNYLGSSHVAQGIANEILARIQTGTKA